ncbi:hypothetical protein [Amycolatopsis thermoflava]|uniref:hypothetical protein n=1 Tax=Amycolatopsis thermoflava TaxID=84480 RepID=UPI0038036C06
MSARLQFGRARKAARWRIARLLDRLPGQCWAELATWAVGLSGRRVPWARIDRMCRTDVERCGACYCGKLRDRTADGGGE